MIRRLLLMLTVVAIIISCDTAMKKEKPFAKEIEFAKKQTNNTLAIAKDPTRIPRTTKEDGKLHTVGIYNWTSGFFAGNLWYLYKLTGEKKWKDEAVKWTEALDTIQYWSGNHDVGFMIYCSYGNGIRFDNRKQYEKVVVQTAESLCKRFNPKTKCIKSWNYRKAWNGETEWFYPVIIDNMMNLELLFEASLISGNNKYRDIAVIHANTTMKNHYRDDYSCYHVIDYDQETGEIKDKATCQGFSDNSSWARGQAWGFYGYVLCYRYTKDPKYLDFAKKIANYIMNNKYLPADKVPLWDYHVNQDGYVAEWDYKPENFKSIPRDASAAAITASAMFELHKYAEGDKTYFNDGLTLLKSLSKSYMADPAKNKYFVLDHSVGSIPHGGEIDVPLVYADYYFMEAIDRYRELIK